MSPIFPSLSNRATILLFLLLASTLTFVAYWGLTDNLFEIDDTRFVLDAKRTWENPAFFFSPNKSLPGRPTTEAFFALIYPIAGDRPEAYHQLLILLHLLTGFTLFYTLYKLGHDFELSALSALFFLLNAAPVRTIQWISCIAYPLALSLGLITMLLFYTYLKTRHKKHLFLTLTFFFLAVLSHPAICIISGLCVYLAYNQYGKSRQTLKIVWPLLTTAILLILVLTTLFSHAPQSYVLTAHSQTSLWHIVLKFLLFYGALFSRAFYLPVEMGWRTVDILFGAGILTLCIFVIYRRKSITVWVLFTIGLLLPFLNVPDEETYSRYLYFASAGSSLVIASTLRYIAHQLPRYKQTIYLALLITLFTLSIFTIKRAESLSLFASGLYHLTQASHIDEPAIKNELIQQGREDFIQAMKHDPRRIPTFALQGLFHGQIFPDEIDSKTQNIKLDILKSIYRVLDGHFFETQTHLNNTATQHPQYQSFIARSWYNLGHVYHQQNQLEAARACFLEALKYDKQNPKILHKRNTY